MKWHNTFTVGRYILTPHCVSLTIQINLSALDNHFSFGSDCVSVPISLECVSKFTVEFGPLPASVLPDIDTVCRGPWVEVLDQEAGFYLLGLYETLKQEEQKAKH